MNATTSGSSSRALFFFLLLYVASAWITEPKVFVEVLSAYSNLLIGGSFLFLLIFLLIALTSGTSTPFKWSRELLKERGLPTALITIGFILGIAGFTSHKININNVNPFYFDPIAADIDHLLHGQDPWRIVHSLGSPRLNTVVDACYTYIWGTSWISAVIYVGFNRNEALRDRYLWSFALTLVICGTILATAFSSVGPVFYRHFYGGDRFVGLVTVLESYETRMSVLDYSDYLLENFMKGQPDRFGTGISAMPSVHVAMAFLNAFLLSRLSRIVGFVGWVYALIILFGSVYTGWHYAIDGYLSIMVVACIWYATGQHFENRD